MSGGDGHWRWNSSITWHYFCSTQFGAVSAAEARNDLMRYHHLRSSIYFAIGTVEAFLNGEMREYLTAKGLDEGAIKKKLRGPKIMEKIEDWPAEMYTKPVAFPSAALELFNAYRETRNEITHPKNHDHSIYLELDKLNTAELVEAVAVALVAMCEAKGKPFPYWLLRWNYVGMNGDLSNPAQLNNVNGFFHSLRFMGFSNLGRDVAFERDHMSTLTDYRLLCDALNKYSREIEPYDLRFPLRPRLTRRWWDRDFILSDVRASAKKAPLD